MPNGMDPDQDRHSVSTDLGPNCLQSNRQTTKIATRKERVKYEYNDICQLLTKECGH